MNAVKQSLAYREEMFPGSGNVSLFARSWRPPGPVRGVVVIVHGFMAHSGMYQWTAERLVALGLAVYAFDLRGHGRSEGDRYWVDDFADYVGDLERFVGLARSREVGAPTYVLGHSAGGVVASLYAVDHQAELAGLISESFAFDLPAPDFALAVMKGLDHIAPHLHVLSLKPEDFSRDPGFVEAMRKDPLVNHMPGPTHTLAALARADAKLRKSFPALSLPVLILHGLADKAAKPHGSQIFFDTVGSKDKTLKLYEGAFHDLLNDVDKERVMGDVTEWLGS
jgi:acylglycerol lipase